MFNKRFFKIFLMVVSASFINTSCAQNPSKDPGSDRKGVKKVVQAVKRAPLSLIITPEGEEVVLGKGFREWKTCYKTKREAKINGGRQCSVFSKERQLKDVKTFTILQSKGSYIYGYIDSSGHYREICYDDSWKVMDCPD